MDSQSRLKATQYIWTAYFFALLIVNGSILFYGEDLEIGHIVLSVFVTFGSVGATGFVWNWGNVPTTESVSPQKGKRLSRIDAILDMMDEKDRAALYQRLAEEANEEQISFGEDGELIKRR